MDEDRTVIDREIDDALAAVNVDPSPDFVARVRARVAREPAPRSWFAWTPIAAGTLAAAVVVGAILLSRPATVQGPAAPLTAKRVGAGFGALLPSRDSSVVSGFRRTDVRSTESSVASAFRRTAVVARHTEPEVLVPRADIDMYRRLIARATEIRGPAVVVEPTVIAAEAATTDIVIEPIKIDPIMPPSGGEGVRQ